LLGPQKRETDLVKPVELTLPLSESDVRGLKTGDLVSLNGRLVTGRDRIHKYLVDTQRKEEPPFDLKGAVLYHCGPVVGKSEEGYTVIAAGPTTSMRVEMYEAEVVRQYGLRGIMGKGGMGEDTRRVLRECGCVYLQTIGGAAVYLASRIRKAAGVWMLEEFGQAEAMWLFEVENFPAIVTMDSYGNDVHAEVEATSLRKLRELTGQLLNNA
jgi:tartrate/fumarate subfamily iron-sulfur-dependent hydro-lyase beta chain